MRTWLVQGFFSQEHMMLGITYVPESLGGARVVVEPEVMSHMWAGVILTNDEGELTGELIDDFGESVLTNVVIEKDKFSFTKRYHQRNDLIDYTFTRNEGFWEGSWSGEPAGSGKTNCILTEVSISFFGIEK